MASQGLVVSLALHPTRAQAPHLRQRNATEQGGLRRLFDRLRVILHEGEIDKRVQYLIEGVTKVRALKFEGHPAIPEGLDLVDDGDRLTHQVDLETPLDAQARTWKSCIPAPRPCTRSSWKARH